jgi:thiol-disulfide isomerase/thioredoxin
MNQLSDKAAIDAALSDAPAGAVVAVAFVASWSKPCKAAIGALSALATAADGATTRIYRVDMDDPDGDGEDAAAECGVGGDLPAVGAALAFRPNDSYVCVVALFL